MSWCVSVSSSLGQRRYGRQRGSGQGPKQKPQTELPRHGRGAPSRRSCCLPESRAMLETGRGGARGAGSSHRDIFYARRTAWVVGRSPRCFRSRQAVSRATHLPSPSSRARARARAAKKGRGIGHRIGRLPRPLHRLDIASRPPIQAGHFARPLPYVRMRAACLFLPFSLGHG